MLLILFSEHRHCIHHIQEQRRHTETFTEARRSLAADRPILVRCYHTQGRYPGHRRLSAQQLLLRNTGLVAPGSQDVPAFRRSCRVTTTTTHARTLSCSRAWSSSSSSSSRLAVCCWWVTQFARIIVVLHDTTHSTAALMGSQCSLLLPFLGMRRRRKNASSRRDNWCVLFTHRIKKELSICQSLLCLDLVSFPVLSQIKPQAPLLVVPFRQFL